MSSTQADEDVFLAELGKYGDAQNQLQQTYSQQADLLNRIQVPLLILILKL
jgi:hypothetical protein